MRIALFPLDVVLFPEASLRLHIFEERYKEMIGECLANETQFGVVRAQHEGLSIGGCMASIRHVLQRYPDGRIDILCEGRVRFEIEHLDDSRSFLQAEVDFFEDEPLDTTREERAGMLALHMEVMSLAGIGRESYALDLDRCLSLLLASELPVDLGLKQRLLMSRSDRERTTILESFYREILRKLRMSDMGAAAASNHGNGHVM